jgi:hypothetical protein
MSSQMSVRVSGVRDTISTRRPPHKGRLDVFEAYGADLAMVLSDNDIGPKRFELLGLDAVDGELSCRMVLTRASMW